MDRRDALKKLGMGGATVVGATMIVSSRAFGATLPAAPTPTVVTVADAEATFSYALNDPQCTGGSDPVGSVVALTDSLTANNGSISGLVLTATGGGQNPKFKQGDTATLTVTTRSTCTYSNATETPVDQTFVFDFAWSPSGNNYLLVTP